MGGIANQSGTTNKIFLKIMANTMVADALGDCVDRSLSAILLTMLDKWGLVFHERGFQQPVPQCRENTLDAILM